MESDALSDLTTSDASEDEHSVHLPSPDRNAFAATSHTSKEQRAKGRDVLQRKRAIEAARVELLSKERVANETRQNTIKERERLEGMVMEAEEAREELKALLDEHGPGPLTGRARELAADMRK